MSNNLDRYAVMGNPIAHSLSPLIHHAFAKQTQQNLVYEKILVPLDGFAAAVTEFKQQGGCGLNITVPFKQQAYAYVDQCDKIAQLAQVVNTITFAADGQAYGTNTDGIGLVRDLTQHKQQSIKDQRLLILGAGGAVRGILPPLLALKPRLLVLSNRTLSKAKQLAQEFAELGQINVMRFADLTQHRFDLIINGTSASLGQQQLPLPDCLITPQCCCYDLAYGAKPTIFLQWAHSLGAKACYDGIGMLVEQAAEAFWLWRGVRPDTTSVLSNILKTDEK